MTPSEYRSILADHLLDDAGDGETPKAQRAKFLLDRLPMLDGAGPEDLADLGAIEARIRAIKTRAHQRTARG